jgi:glycosyltransferase involved in cell wall biosynthesis
VRTLVFIPAWNEEASVAEVVADVSAKVPGADVLVVDDGSTDATAARARAAGSRVASLPFNQGLGAALQTGYLYALREGYDFCAHLDADGQHPAGEVERLLEEVREDRADLVIGSRYHDPGGEETDDYQPTLSRRIGSRRCRCGCSSAPAAPPSSRRCARRSSSSRA